MQIRHATPSDVDAITAVEQTCFPAAEAASRDSFVSRLATFPDHFWLVEEEGELIAFLNGAVLDTETIADSCYEHANCHNPKGKYQSVFGLNTLPACRKRGIAAAMLRAMIAQAKEEGRDGCILACKDHLVHYYASFGFVRMGRSASTHGGASWNDMILNF